MMLLFAMMFGCAAAATVSGTVQYERGAPPPHVEVAVALMMLETHDDGSLKPLSKAAVQGADLSFGLVSPAAFEAVADDALAFAVAAAPGAYAVVAYERPRGTSAWINFTAPHPNVNVPST